jgi:polysaccharide biosynthesis/export protein
MTARSRSKNIGERHGGTEGNCHRGTEAQRTSRFFSVSRCTEAQRDSKVFSVSRWLCGEFSLWLCGLTLVAGLASTGVSAQQPPAAATASAPPRVSAPAAAAVAAPAAPAGVAVPGDYVIGPEDVLAVVYWRDKDMSTEVSVRPDGKISLPLLNDVQAAGLTPAQLRDRLIDASKEYFEDPSVTIVVRQMNSRKVFITGEVNKPGPYPLIAPTTVLQLISIAGGLHEYADSKKILIVRNENGRPTSFSFNYKDVISRKNLRQNIELKPGDTVIVP